MFSLEESQLFFPQKRSIKKQCQMVDGLGQRLSMVRIINGGRHEAEWELYNNKTYQEGMGKLYKPDEVKQPVRKMKE